jgi:hypothetical protein
MSAIMTLGFSNSATNPNEPLRTVTGTRYCNWDLLFLVAETEEEEEEEEEEFQRTGLLTRMPGY